MDDNTPNTTPEGCYNKFLRAPEGVGEGEPVPPLAERVWPLYVALTEALLERCRPGGGVEPRHARDTDASFSFDSEHDARFGVPRRSKIGRRVESRGGQA